MSAILACEDVHKAYGGVVVLRGVTLAVRAGEILGLVGANGAGKTTLVDIISSCTRQDSGAIRIDGRALTAGAVTRARAGLARTFQHPQLAADLSVRDNVRVGLSVARLGSLPRILAEIGRGLVGAPAPDGARIDEVCRGLGLEDLDRRASDVTLGEQRLVEVARALAQGPRAVILDEPFSGVGDSGIESILTALRTLRAAGCAVLLIDHNIDLLIPLVDRMALLFQGRIAVEGSVAACLASDTFRDAYVGAV